MERRESTHSSPPHSARAPRPYLRKWSWPDEHKGRWGPKGWRWVHLTAILYPARPSREEAADVFARLWSFLSGLPCGECRQHAIQFFSRNPPDLSSGAALQLWAWRFHNTVNARLGKRIISYDEYRKIYGLT